MGKERIIVFDNSEELCMYPLEGESDADFKKRMQKLSKKRASKLTEQDKKFAASLLNGKIQIDLEEVPEDEE